MVKTFEIKINLDNKCKRCGKGGATESGICLSCMARTIKNGELNGR